MWLANGWPKPGSFHNRVDSHEINRVDSHEIKLIGVQAVCFRFGLGGGLFLATRRSSALVSTKVRNSSVRGVWPVQCRGVHMGSRGGTGSV